MVNSLFVDFASQDFHLHPTSPLINAGVSPSQVLHDFDGILRPPGGLYDIGAFESQWTGRQQWRLFEK